ncbi:similar to Saccharomyces cerevisiae YDR395W SXM1 Nuclear transport factor (karyopherin) involved in protein transport between the cytoplasm and nucleoplasm [Maudiozyma barnettii]|uniref:Similar to Saccharomyces cerevisiae YDR395W SXM1 Nuclear transport factor (Karyopherin) involved in protein transport between the cytoplasm and nucleoplasm n=1 Tax=Maudiozyma barnettii TaxID=61262 RepID=A0A8H2VDV5_9SACH|nr:Sxm1p [Kazachstania barnettii]CAB4253725.1 similar to Saccharomyces cerevisiae YDR395W SXM1 Nuclear transport factor (karyopherin) involved in protein transport between the cytoplasm and nucleoplasm [Kazachstania barnettii]CAD1781473.1 similar to Saccharomyces cerevisiae YDR395W SXM1 Nuclear transport factor (karyopherin) involved in protein transport between the cytoplasm and nucleoplasm [Kazachstania barnettii]
MLDEQAIIACTGQTMVADAKLIKEAELKLFEFQKEAGFTFLLLKIVSNVEIPLNIRMSCAIYFKNKVFRSWVNYNITSQTVSADDINPEEQQMIKDNIIQIIVSNVNDNHITPHLTEALYNILIRCKDWDLTGPISELLTSGKHDYTYAGLLVVFEICKVHRYDLCDKREFFDKFISTIFPTIEGLLSQLVNQTDFKSSELLYLILKSFKYACLNNFPAYFNDVSKLDSWIQLHLFICAKPAPKEVLEIDISDRSLDKRVKVNKWGFGNLNRFIHRYSKVTKHVNEQFVANVFSNVIPRILQEYFSIMNTWNQKSLWLSDASLYHLIRFLDKCLVTDGLYPLIEPHLEGIFKTLIFTCLCANEEVAELFEIDPEDYTRRYFDFNKEGSTSDVASVDFIARTGTGRPEQLSVVIPFVNDIFNQFVQTPDNVEVAYKQEGAMRSISSLFMFFEGNTTELEGIFTHYIINILSQTKYPYLIARGLSTVADYQSEFQNMETLSKIYELAYKHLMETDSLPIQIEAADALRTLIISNPSIRGHISGQVPGIVERLLKLSKEFEIDILSEVMESFVENFADELTPFAKDLGRSLTEQYLRLGQTMIETGSDNYFDQDQELQASSLLQTMTTMAMSMNKVSLEEEFIPVCKFIIQNAQIILLTEVVDLMDALTLSSRNLNGGMISENIWSLFGEVLESFEIYSMDYFEAFNIFFETIVLHGFPTNQTYIEPFFQILSAKLTSGIDYDIENVFNLLTMYSLSMHDIPLFGECLKVANDKDLGIDPKQTMKLFWANLMTKPMETLQICELEGQTLNMITMWFDLKIASVFGIKLQIMAILAIFKMEQLPSSIEGFFVALSNKLVELLESLPRAIQNRDSANNDENVANLLVGNDDGNNNVEDEDDYFDDIDDDFKETELDQVNAFETVHQVFQALQTQSANKYQHIVESLDPKKKQSLQVIFEFVAQPK